MAELGAGALGAVATIIGAANSHITGFSGRHDISHDSLVQETQRWVEAFQRSVKDGDITVEDHNESNAKREAYVHTSRYLC